MCISHFDWTLKFSHLRATLESKANETSTFIKIIRNGCGRPYTHRTHVSSLSCPQFSFLFFLSFSLCVVGTHNSRNSTVSKSRIRLVCICVGVAERVQACGCTNKSKTENLLWFVKNFVLFSCGEFFVCRLSVCVFSMVLGTPAAANVTRAAWESDDVG